MKRPVSPRCQAGLKGRQEVVHGMRALPDVTEDRTADHLSARVTWAHPRGTDVVRRTSAEVGKGPSSADVLL